LLLSLSNKKEVKLGTLLPIKELSGKKHSKLATQVT
jgi:hypothetical protein